VIIANSFQQLPFTKLLSHSLCCKLYKHSCPCTKIIRCSSSMTNVAWFHTGHLHLITTFLELGVVARRSRTRERRPHAISGRPMLIHIYHAVPLPRPCRHPAVALRGRFQNGIFVAWQGNVMAYVNQTQPHCVNQMGKTQSKPLTERRGMCESALIVTFRCSCAHFVGLRYLAVT
jgi:hypothetical protein